MPGFGGHGASEHGIHDREQKSQTDTEHTQVLSHLGTKSIAHDNEIGCQVLIERAELAPVLFLEIDAVAQQP